MNRCQRLEHDLMDLHSHQDMETEEQKITLEQTRKTYQRELEEITRELAMGRESEIQVWEENRYHLR